MKYLAILSLYCNDFTNYTFENYGSTMQSAINKVRKQAVEYGLNALNSHGQINICKRKDSEYDEHYYHLGIVSAWK